MENANLTQRSKFRSRLIALVESAMLIALAYVLSSILKIKVVPYGGSVTALSMLPILLIGIRRGTPWGLGAGIVYGGLQMLQEFYAPPAGTLAALIGMILLDYIAAFGVLGFSGLFRKMKSGLLFAVPVCLILRYVSHVLSGVLLWSSYRWEGWAVWPYSLAYNLTFMGPELILTAVAAFAMVKSKTDKVLLN